MSFRLQITSIALLTVFIVNTFILNLVFISVRQYIKCEMKEKLRGDLADSELKTVELTQNEYKQVAWLEENEVKINGALYDVRTIDFKNDKVILKVISDEKEEQILKEMEEQESQKQPLKKGTQFAFLFFPGFDSGAGAWSFRQTSSSPEVGFTYFNNYTSFARKLNTPPPKTV